MNFYKIAFCSIICIGISIIVTPYVFAPRYLIVPLVLFILIPAKAAEYFLLNSSKNQIFTALILLFTIIVLLVAIFNSMQAINLTLKSGECNVVGPICQGSQMINEQANRDERVFFHGYYTYWLKDNIIMNQSTVKERRFFGTLNSPEERVKYLYDNKFKYIFSDGSIKDVTQLYNMGNRSQPFKLEKIFEKEKVMIFKISKNS